MHQHIYQYVHICQSWILGKAPTDAKCGFLNPLPVPNRPWQELSMDFVTGLAVSKPEGFDAIMVVVDRLTKITHLISCNTTVNVADVAKLSLHNICKIHGLPTHITSDTGTQFTAQFWQALLHYLKIKRRMSTPYQPETDG